MKEIDLIVRVTCDVERMKIPDADVSESEETGFWIVVSSLDGVMSVF